MAQLFAAYFADAHTPPYTFTTKIFSWTEARITDELLITLCVSKGLGVDN